MGGGALGRWLFVACTTFVSLSSSVAAQGPSGLRPIPDSSSAPQRPSAPALVHYGKWVALGGAVGLGILSVQRHDDANTSYQALQTRCFDLPSSCQLAGDAYLDPVNEALYQETRHLDHQAARYLIGTETLFAASVAGFVWELMHRHAEPKNIPFEPRVEAGAQATHLGINVRF